MRTTTAQLHERAAYERGFKDATAIADADALVRIANALELIAGRYATPDPFETEHQKSVEEYMQQRADSNRDNAGKLFPELVYIANRNCYHDRDGDRVVFTPYGYQKEKDVPQE